MRIVLIMLSAAVLWQPAAASAQTAANAFPAGYKAPRTADGTPDLNGIWQTMNTANWDLEEHAAQASPVTGAGGYLMQPPGYGVVEGGTIPYKPEALLQKKKNLASRLSPDAATSNEEWPEGDSEAKCFAPAPPRGTYLGYPFQIVQSKGAVLIAYEFGSTPRVVHMGEVNRDVFYGVDTWMGQSRGRYEGDTLVIETTNFSGVPWLDRAGNFISQTAKITERFTPASPFHLMYEATIDDARLFTRPWKISMPVYKRVDKNAELLDLQCVDSTEEFLYSKYVKKSTR